MDHIKKYPEDFSRPLLVLLELWSKANVNFFNDDQLWLAQNWRFFYMIPFILGHFMSMSVAIVKELNAETGRNLYEFLSLPIVIISFQAIFKTIISLSNKRRLENLIDELGRVWRTDGLNDRQNAVKKAEARELRFAVIAYVRVSMVVTWQYLLLPLATTLATLVRGDLHGKRLPLMAEYPFDPNDSWLLYGATYAYQVYCTLLIVYVYLGSDFTVIALSAHLSREFLILREDFANIRPCRLGNCDNGDILNFILSHQRLIRLAEELDAAINKLIFINILFTIVNVSFFGLSVLAANSLADKLIFVILVVNCLMLILVQCYFGEKVKAASEEIYQAACESLWYEGDINYQNTLYYIMMRSQKPCYLTSLKYTKISLQTFTTVLSTTWSYLSLVNTMYQRRE